MDGPFDLHWLTSRRTGESSIVKERSVVRAGGRSETVAVLSLLLPLLDGASDGEERRTSK